MEEAVVIERKGETEQSLAIDLIEYERCKMQFRNIFDIDLPLGTIIPQLCYIFLFGGMIKDVTHPTRGTSCACNTEGL
jgi:hypothetical protein